MNQAASRDFSKLGRLCALLLLLMGHVTAHAAESPEKPPTAATSASNTTPITPEIQELQKIDALGRAKNLDALAALVDELEKRPDRASQHFLAVLRTLCDTLRHYDFGADTGLRPFRLAQKCAYLALQRADELPFETEMALLPVVKLELDDPAQTVSVEEQKQHRNKKIALLLHPWKRIRETAKLPLPKGIIFANIPAPFVGTGTPEQREYYAKLLKENNERSVLTSKIYTALRYESSWPNEIKWYLIQIYRTPPPDLDGLKKLMDAAELPAELQKSVLDALQTTGGKK